MFFKLRAYCLTLVLSDLCRQVLIYINNMEKHITYQGIAVVREWSALDCLHSKQLGAERVTWYHEAVLLCSVLLYRYGHLQANNIQPPWCVNYSICSIISICLCEVSVTGYCLCVKWGNRVEMLFFISHINTVHWMDYKVSVFIKLLSSVYF